MAIIPKGGGGKPEEEKTVTAGTSTKVVTPSDGKTIKKVTVNPTPSQSKTVSPSTSQQTVSPDSGKLLSQVIVKAMEDVTPEVTAQTPMISQILSNLGFTADSASGTNKQKLQTNNANLAKIEDYLPHGVYVWKKLTAQGGDFVNFVVSDQSTAYPDGGLRDGYWYEKVVEVDILYKGFAELKGYSKIAKDKFIYSNDLSISTSSSSPTKFSHSLGETPKAVMIIADRFKKTTAQTSSKYHQLLIACLQQYADNDSTCAGVVWRCNDSYLNYSVSNVGGIRINSLSNSQVQVYFVTYSDGNNYPVLCAGVEYTLITMA